MNFTLKSKDQNSKARSGLIKTDHGVIQTPIFMPVGTAGTVKSVSQKDLEDQEKTLSKMDDGIVMEDHYTFGTGDIVNNKNTNCTHYGSKGIVIQIPQQGYVRYTVTNSGDTYKPGDILTKTADQLEKI